MQESPVKGLIQTNMLLGGQVGNKNVRVPGNEQSPQPNQAQASPSRGGGQVDESVREEKKSSDIESEYAI